MATIKGQSIKNCRTLKSMYDMDSIAMEDSKGNDLRMKVHTIEAMLNEFVFKKAKAKKYTYLEIDWDATNKMRNALDK